MTRLPGDRRAARRARVAAATLAVVVLATPLLAGCGTSGRSMKEPSPGATAPPRKPDPTTTTIAGANTQVTSDLLTVTSSAFPPGGEIPSGYTCDGSGTAFPLTFSNVPAGTTELALVVTDPDAGDFVHWVVAGIPASTTGLDGATVPPGAVQLRNSQGAVGYAPPCPPQGTTHTYDVALYALDAPSGLTQTSDSRTAIVSLAANATATAVLTGSYARTTAN